MIVGRSIRLLAVSVALGAAAACNRNYADLMATSDRLEGKVEEAMGRYTSGADELVRLRAKTQVVAIRERQLVMMERIEVSTMPLLVEGKITEAEAQRRKQGLVDAARHRVAEAQALRTAVDR